MPLLGAGIVETPVLPGGFCESVMHGLDIKMIPMTVIIQITIIKLMRRKQFLISTTEIIPILLDVEVLIYKFLGTGCVTINVAFYSK